MPTYVVCVHQKPLPADFRCTVPVSLPATYLRVEADTRAEAADRALGFHWTRPLPDGVRHASFEDSQGSSGFLRQMGIDGVLDVTEGEPNPYAAAPAEGAPPGPRR